MSDPAAPAAPATQRTISQAPIKPIDAAQFGKKAELAEKLKAILKDVPVLHERLKGLIVELEKTNAEFKAATDRATAIVTEWEKLK